MTISVTLVNKLLVYIAFITMPYAQNASKITIFINLNVMMKIVAQLELIPILMFSLESVQHAI